MEDVGSNLRAVERNVNVNLIQSCLARTASLGDPN